MILWYLRTHPNATLKEITKFLNRSGFWPEFEWIVRLAIYKMRGPYERYVTWWYLNQIDGDYRMAYSLTERGQDFARAHLHPKKEKL